MVIVPTFTGRSTAGSTESTTPPRRATTVTPESIATERSIPVPTSGASVRKTGRLVIVEEDNLTGGWAAWVAAGSMGLIGHPLRAGLTWLLMAGMLLAALSPGKHRDRPRLRNDWPRADVVWGPRYALILIGTALAVAMSPS